MPYPYSGNTTVFGSSLSLIDATAGRDQVRASRVSSRLSAIVGELWAGTSGVSVEGSIRASGVTLDLRTAGVKLSYATLADASSLTLGTLGIVFQASGISLIYSSGKTSYVLGQSSQSAAGS